MPPSRFRRWIGDALAAQPEENGEVVMVDDEDALDHAELRPDAVAIMMRSFGWLPWGRRQGAFHPLASPALKDLGDREALDIGCGGLTPLSTILKPSLSNFFKTALTARSEALPNVGRSAFQSALSSAVTV